MSKILDVLNYFNVPIIEKNGKLHIECPVCGKLKPTYPFWVDDKNDTFNCAKCGFKGGFVSLFYYLENGYEMQPGSRKEYAAYVFKKLYGDYSDESFSKNNRIKKKEKDYIKKEEYIAPLNERHNTYKKLLNSLSLCKKHEELLCSDKRGLSIKQIKKLEYKSMPEISKPIIKSLKESGCQFKGIPGFYIKNNDWELKNIKGILLPVRHYNGLIQGFQVMNDRPEYGKYIFLSSGNEKQQGGTSAKSWVHVQGNIKEAKNIIITEGVLKSDIVYCYTNIPVISLLGVNSQAYISETIKQTNKDCIFHISFDMDKEKNYYVYTALYNLCKTISENNRKFVISEWSPLYKGLDDYILEMLF